MSHSIIRHKNPRGKLTHPSQGQELESAGRFTDQTKNIISSKKCEKVLYVTVIYTTYMAIKLNLMRTQDNEMEYPHEDKYQTMKLMMLMLQIHLYNFLLK